MLPSSVLPVTVEGTDTRCSLTRTLLFSTINAPLERVEQPRPPRAQLTALPNELMHIVLRFLFPAIAPLVRVSKSVWERLKFDRHVWMDIAQQRQASREGRALLLPVADRFVERCPELNRVLPRTLSTHARRYAVSPDGKFFACGDATELKVFDADTCELIAEGTLENNLSALCFSAYPSLLACAESYSCVCVCVAKRARAH